MLKWNFTLTIYPNSEMFLVEFEENLATCHFSDALYTPDFQL